MGRQIHYRPGYGFRVWYTVADVYLCDFVKTPEEVGEVLRQDEQNLSHLPPSNSWVSMWVGHARKIQDGRVKAPLAQHGSSCAECADYHEFPVNDDSMLEHDHPFRLYEWERRRRAQTEEDRRVFQKETGV